MNKKIIKTLFLLLVIFVLQFTFAFTLTDGDVVKGSAETVYLGGFPAGFEVKSKGATVVKLTDVVTNEGVVSPAKDAGILEGDTLLSVGGVDIFCADDVSKGLDRNTEGSVVITVLRDGKETLKEIVPAKDINGKKRLGLMLRDGTSGIGTMTFIDGSGNFMALGHPICNENGIIDIGGGEIFRCSIFGVNKGERGRAGELKGIFVSDSPIGVVTKNTSRGIVGKMKDDYGFDDLPNIAIGKAEMGKASIITCVDGVIPKEYDVSIVKTDGNKNDKNLVIKVTDKNLLREAGGIVQGMSGSPIVQNGKLVGAVTHVFVNDPTRGYGIGIDNMLEVL